MQQLKFFQNQDEENKKMQKELLEAINNKNKHSDTGSDGGKGKSNGNGGNNANLVDAKQYNEVMQTNKQLSETIAKAETRN